MAELSRPDLFDRRLLVVVGKGGVGKTTVACLLGLLGAQRGKKVLIAEVDGAGRAARLLGVRPAEIGSPQVVRSSVSVMSVEGTAALAEYLQIILPVKRVIQAVLASRIYQYFVAAAPGLKELMTIGKIWYEAERIDDSTGERTWDVVIVDAPATGHSMQYLSMPRAAHEVFRAGLVGRESKRLVDLMTDPVRTAINLVTTAEEMPVNEAIEMYGRLRDDLQMPLGYVFVNRLHRATFDEKMIESLGDASRLADARDRALVEEALRRAREEAGWTAINATYLQRLRDAVPMPSVELPYIYAEEFGVEQVRELSLLMEAALGLAKRGKKHARA
ncbi:MAG TPA: ArsA-related P-loop ATPase [Candidatus Acidoferrales bacterium]|nr:ArsA-related P-loop ATPase [Candidatus Acidoferrales bacterium]